MSDHEREALDCLFAGQATKLDNLKFARGTDAVIPEERLYEELCASVGRRASRKDDLSEQPPRCTKQALDVREWVASM